MRNLNRVYRVLFTAAAILLSGCHRGMASSNQSQAASILTEQFETVFYAQAGLLKGSAGYKELPAKNANSLRVPFSDLIGGLQSLGAQVPIEVFEAANAVLVGAKDFQPPKGLGAVRSQFCFVVAFRDGSQVDISRVAKTSSSISSLGDGIWTWETKPTEGQSGPQKFFAVQRSRDYLLVSNDLATLRAIAGGLATLNRTPFQVPNGISDWKTLSGHDLWGHRRYRQNEVHDKNAAGTTDVTPTATSLLFFVDADKKAAALRLFASDGSTAEKMNASRKLPLLRPVGTNSWEANISLSDDEVSVERVLSAMWLFGFGIYL
jgi:hypothetical protein